MSTWAEVFRAAASKVMGRGTPEHRIHDALYRIRTNRDMMGVGVLADRMKEIVPVPDELAGKMSTNGKGMYYDPSYVESISDSDLRFVVVHNLTHIALGHHYRMAGKNLYIANQAADIIVNRMLRQSKAFRTGFITWPEGGLYDPRFDDRSHHFESVYWQLLQEHQDRMENMPKQQQGGQQPGNSQGESQQGQQGNAGSGSQQGQQGQGGGGGGQQQDQQQSPSGGQQKQDQKQGEQDQQDGQNEQQNQGQDQQQGQSNVPQRPQELQHNDSWGEIWKAPPFNAKQFNEEMGQIGAAMARVKVQQKMIGSGSGSLTELIDQEDGHVEQWDLLREMLDSIYSDSRTWARPNLSFSDHGYLPAREKALGTLHICLDTSGSVSPQEMANYLKNTRAICDQLGIKTIKVSYVDNTLHRNEYGDAFTEIEVTDSRDVEFRPTGNGGTSFDPVFRAAEEDMEDITAMIYFTDGEGYCSEPPPQYHVIWASSSCRPMDEDGNPLWWGHHLVVRPYNETYDHYTETY